MFSVYKRNPGHWDVCNQQGRLFRVRGVPGSYVVMDERVERRPNSKILDFKTISSCMSYICDELMFELIVADGQEPTVIESWNV